MSALPARSSKHGYEFIDDTWNEIPIEYVGKITPKVYVTNESYKLLDYETQKKVTPFSEVLSMKNANPVEDITPESEEIIPETKEEIIPEEPEQEEKEVEELIPKKKLKYKKRVKEFTPIGLFNDHQKYLKRIKLIEKRMKKLSQ